jgi:hypothetical protein
VSGRHAILVGVDGYAFQPLASAVNDAVAMREELLGNATPALAPLFAASEVTLLATPADGNAAALGVRTATRDNVLNALKAHYEEDDPLDFLLVFFAGHGVMVSADGRTRQTLILPSDVSGPEDGRNMISLTELLEVFAERGPRQQLWIVDACRDMPYQRRPRGYELEWNERAAQGQRAQVAIYAVAPGGTALSEAGGQGRLTGHLLKGLAGSGAAVDYVPARGHCVTAPSLHDYAKRRVVEVLTPYDDWTRAVQTPQIYQNGPALSPLRDVPAPEPRPFRVNVAPAEAAAAIELALEVQYGIPTPGWPPRALPRVYELRAALRSDMKQAGWGEPKPRLVAVDVREQESVDIEVPRSAAQEAPPPAAVTSVKGVAPLSTIRHTPAPGDIMSAAALPRFDVDDMFTDHFQDPGARGRQRKFSLGGGELGAPPAAAGAAPGASAPVSVAESPVSSMATLRVRSADSAARVRLRRAQAPWDEREATTDVAISIESGVWDVKVGFGDYTSSATRVVLGPGEMREIEAMAQITPTTAALLPPHMALANAASVMPSESIGPMQGAVLPTLLPLLALKIFDHNQQILRQFAHLRIPALSPAEWPLRPFAVALAREGHSGDARLAVVDGEEVWRDAKAQVALFVGSQRGARGTLTLDIGKRRVDIAAPHVPGAVTAVTVTAWPNGRMDYSVCLFRLPVGESFLAGGPRVEVGKISRALAIAAPLFRTGARFDNVSDSLLLELAHAKWLDPVLGALAYHAHDHRLTTLATNAAEVPMLTSLRGIIAHNLAAHFPELPDSRIIAALAGDAAQRRLAFRALLADAELGQPVLVASLAHLANAALEQGNLAHFAVERMDRVVPGEVFNAIRTM